MSEGLPLVTLVIAGELDDQPGLTEVQEGLKRTLSMLCSFLSLEDFFQFLLSQSFVDFCRTPEPWVQFELGLYVDHTKTLQLIPEQRHFMLVDEAMTGALDGGVWTGEPDEAMKAVLGRWITEVSSGHQ